jgi:hypothetical protein
MLLKFLALSLWFGQLEDGIFGARFTHAMILFILRDADWHPTSD